MTDALGQSQVIPYVLGVAQAGYKVTLLSTEKHDRYKQYGERIRKLLSENNIVWEHILFTKNPPLVSKYFDLINLKTKAERLHKRENFKLVHCRSYVAADAGLLLKKKYGIKFLFDMLGFWVDERVDGGIWNLSNPVYKRLYTWYKKKEKTFIKNADAIISLTHAGKNEMQKWDGYTNQTIDVIPCSADFDLFTLTNEATKSYSRKKLGINSEDFVVSYLGSIGTWYMIDEMLQFFKLLKSKKSNSKFLFITNGEHEFIKSKAKQFGINEHDILLTSGTRAEVPDLVKASDMSISFIKPCYSKLSSSPTKLGELLAMGIPCLCNSGVGDVKETVINTKGGIIIDDFTDATFINAINKIDDAVRVSPGDIRKSAFEIYDLHKAQQHYVSIYKRLLKDE